MSLIIFSRGRGKRKKACVCACGGGGERGWEESIFL